MCGCARVVVGVGGGWGGGVVVDVGVLQCGSTTMESLAYCEAVLPEPDTSAGGFKRFHHVPQREGGEGGGGVCREGSVFGGGYVVSTRTNSPCLSSPHLLVVDVLMLRLCTQQYCINVVVIGMFVVT